MHTAALALALQPGVTYRDVAAQMGVEPAVVLRWLREGLAAAATAAAAQPRNSRASHSQRSTESSSDSTSIRSSLPWNLAKNSLGDTLRLSSPNP